MQSLRSQTATGEAPVHGREGPCGGRGGAQLPTGSRHPPEPVGVRAALTPVISGCGKQDGHPRE